VRRLAPLLIATGCFDSHFRVTPSCGDKVLDPGEECDDGNWLANDSCDQLCRFTSCGDGKVTGMEGCDDGARLWGDDGVDGVACKPDCSEPESTCDTPPTATYCSIEEIAWVRNCSFTRAGCHVGPAFEGARLNLERGAWRNLVCAPATTEDGAGKCRVVPYSLEDSYLWTRLTGDGLGTCDFRCNLMPWPNGGLCHEKYVAIREWILAGAPDPSGRSPERCDPGCALPAGFVPDDACPDPVEEDAGPADAGLPDAAPDAGPLDAAPTDAAG